MFETILTILSLIGNYMNCRKVRACFLLWIGVNACWAYLDIKRGAYSRGVLDIVQIGFSIYGIKKWRSQSE